MAELGPCMRKCTGSRIGCVPIYRVYRAVRELGMSGTSVGKQLGLGQPAVSRAVMRGEKLAHNKMRNAFFHDRPNIPPDDLHIVSSCCGRLDQLF